MGIESYVGIVTGTRLPQFWKTPSDNTTSEVGKTAVPKLLFPMTTNICIHTSRHQLNHNRKWQQPYQGPHRGTHMILWRRQTWGKTKRLSLQNMPLGKRLSRACKRKRGCDSKWVNMLICACMCVQGVGDQWILQLSEMETTSILSITWESSRKAAGYRRRRPGSI